ncbi:MAG TPA: glycosyltransferase family 4 protein [Rhodanobacteraceae bacterium]|nr:glycosyltransferase family 4 protein [Rhodanobacteraceae bacterium]
MRVAHINFLPAPAGMDIAQLLVRWPSLADIAELVSTAGIEVSVLQAARHPEHLTRNGVDYRFVDVGGARVARWRGRCFARVLRDLEVDVLHAHGLAFAEDAFAISQCLSPSPPVVFQDHADALPRWWRRTRLRRSFAVASGVAFTSQAQARPFTAAGLIAPHTRVFAIPESSSRFTPGDRDAARAATGLHGDPCVSWVGHLDRNKDPLTVLDGVARATQRLPGLQLWCAHGSAPLLAAVRARIDGDPRLRGRVHLLGKVPHARVEQLLRASDLFVSGSHAEGSGYAATEAVACGVTPVLTDIAAFPALTDNGRIGHLYPRGDPVRLADTLVVAATNRTPRERVRAHFDASLSFAAVGRKWADAYAQVLEDRWRRAA